VPSVMDLLVESVFKKTVFGFGWFSQFILLQLSLFFADCVLARGCIVAGLLIIVSYSPGQHFLKSFFRKLVLSLVLDLFIFIILVVAF
jgi:hypothetical protein